MSQSYSEDSVCSKYGKPAAQSAMTKVHAQKNMSLGRRVARSAYHPNGSENTPAGFWRDGSCVG